MKPIAEYLEWLADKEPGLYEPGFSELGAFVGSRNRKLSKAFPINSIRNVTNGELYVFDHLTQDACDEIAAAIGYVLFQDCACCGENEYLLWGYPMCKKGDWVLEFIKPDDDEPETKCTFIEIPETKRLVAIETLCAAIAHKHGEV